MGYWTKYCRLTQLNCCFYVIEITWRPLTLALAAPLPHLRPALKSRVMARPWDLSHLMLSNGKIQCVRHEFYLIASLLSRQNCKLCRILTWTLSATNRSTLPSTQSSKVQTTWNEHGGEAREHGCSSQCWAFRHRNCNCAWVLWLVSLLVMQETQFDSQMGRNMFLFCLILIPSSCCRREFWPSFTANNLRRRFFKKAFVSTFFWG